MKKILSNPGHIFTTIAIFGALATATYLSFAVFTPAIAQVQTGNELAANCASFRVGEGIEKNTLFDPDKGIVYVRLGEHEDFDIRLPYNPKTGFKGCSLEAKELLQEIKQGHEKFLSESCADFQAIISGEKPLPEKGGRKANIQGAIDFVEQYCKQ